MLDYESGESALGKPGGADLQLGLATGPALYAWEEHAEMGALIARKFEKEGDVELVNISVFFLYLSACQLKRERVPGSGPCSPIVRCRTHERARGRVCRQSTGDSAAFAGERG